MKRPSWPMFLLAAGILFSCQSMEEGSPSQESSSEITNEESSLSSDSLDEQSILFMGTSAEFPPYEFYSLVDGENTIVGFDISIANAIAEELGITLVIKDIVFDDLFSALVSGEIDLILAGMTPTEERATIMDFSDLYYIEKQSVLIRAANAQELLDQDSLAGRTIGVQKESPQEWIVQDILSESSLTMYPGIPKMILELQNGRVDALILEDTVARTFAQNDETLIVSSIDLEIEEYGSAVAVQKGQQELLDRINQAIAKLKSDGSIDRFVTQAYLSLPVEE